MLDSNSDVMANHEHHDQETLRQKLEKLSAAQPTGVVLAALEALALIAANDPKKKPCT